MTGRRLLHYELLDRIGQGGMGVVYKARDLRLGRLVAIKILPEARMADPERRRRFVQEARAASALNHPNIVTIHDIDTAGVDFISMEYVSGKTLERLIAGKGLPLGDALRFAVQIADALTRAHSAGILHRDLKPSNVMVNEHGLVKVLDFGLAKLTQPEDREPEATLSAEPMTSEGRIVGTAAYMSPEQAEGRPLDARSDIFSFGAVLYEMITGRRAFPGDTHASTLAAVIAREPPPLGKSVPREVERIVRRCLRKDPARRFQHMGDLKVVLEDLKEESDSGTLDPGIGAAAGVGRRRRRLALTVGAVVLVAAGAAALWFFGLASGRPDERLVPLAVYGGDVLHPSFSPDGSQVAFAWDGEKKAAYHVYIKMVDQPGPVRLTGNPAPEGFPAWSPDGRSIVFLRQTSETSTEGAVILIPAIGGFERDLGKVHVPSKPAWSPDGKWIAIADGPAAGPQASVYLLSPESGDRRRITSSPAGTERDMDPAFSPDGRQLAFRRARTAAAASVYVQSLGADYVPIGDPRPVTPDDLMAIQPAWTRDGRDIIFADADFHWGLWRVPASGSRRPQRLALGQHGSHPDIARQGGKLAYTLQHPELNIWSARFNESGEPRVGPLIATVRFEANPQYSPDGKRIAFGSDRSGNPEIWVSDTDGSNASQITKIGKGHSGSPRWSPDSRRIAFDSNVSGRWQIYTVSADGGQPQQLTREPADSYIPSYSHDGKWIYFGSSRTGRVEISKVPAGGGNPVQVTHSGGLVAFESLDGKWLFYTKSDSRSALWRSPTAGGEEVQVIPGMYPRAFSVTRRGVYFMSPLARGPGTSLNFYSFDSGATKVLLVIDRMVIWGIAVAPDERSVAWSQYDQSGSDLMMIENFR